MNRAPTIAGLITATLLAAPAAHAIVLTTYQSDTNLGDYTSQVGSYATLSNFSAGDVSGPFTPTDATVAAGLRVYQGGSVAGLPTNNWILASFSSAQASLIVFPNIDHLGAAYDGFQYQIWGKSDSGAWTQLYDPTAVVGSGEPFMLGSNTGTAPTWVDNVGTVPGVGPHGQVGYIARFDFGSAYSEYAFGASSVAYGNNPSPNTDQELTAVGSVGVPEPATLGLLGVGLLSLARKRRRA